MGVVAYQNGFPPPQTPIVDKTGAFTKDGRYLLLAVFNRTGQSDGVPNVQPALTVVAGTTFNIVGDWNQFTKVPSGGVAQLPAMAVGTDCIIWNDDGANALSVTPQSGVQIDALGVGIGYSLAAGKMQWFRAVTTTLIHSMQLG